MVFPCQLNMQAEFFFSNMDNNKFSLNWNRALQKVKKSL